MFKYWLQVRYFTHVCLWVHQLVQLFWCICCFDWLLKVVRISNLVLGLLFVSLVLNPPHYTAWYAATHSSFPTHRLLVASTTSCTNEGMNWAISNVNMDTSTVIQLDEGWRWRWAVYVVAVLEIELDHQHQKGDAWVETLCLYVKETLEADLKSNFPLTYTWLQ